MQEGLPSARETFRRIRRHLVPAMALAGKLAGQGAVEESALGCRVRLSDGRQVLDFGSYAVQLLGHRNPSVIEAVRHQLDVMPTSTRSLSNPVSAAAAEHLVEYLGGALGRVYFGMNGADAVEAAIKLARLATGRTTVVAATGGYHGKSMGALALTHHERYRQGLTDLLAGVVHVDPRDPGAVAAVAARAPVAAIVFEPVQGENGVFELDGAVLRQWCADAHAADAFVIADEIQVGLRRCGAPSVALQDRLPVDAVLLGKPLGGGVVPLSAAVCSQRLYAPLIDDPFRHTATFGGQPLCTAAVPAALAAIEANAENGTRVADRIQQALVGIHHRHGDLVTAVRGRGLLWGVDFSSPQFAGEVQLALAREGLLVSPCLSRPETLRLLPPITAAADDVDEAVAAVERAVVSAAKVVRPDHGFQVTT